VLISLSRLAQHPISKNKFKEQISRLVIREQAGLHQNRNAIFISDGDLVVHVDLASGMHKQIPTYDWMLTVEWLLHVSLPKYQGNFFWNFNFLKFQFS
jgi:hypothetical protein